jgi:hypothetical protein
LQCLVSRRKATNIFCSGFTHLVWHRKV